MTTQPQKSYAFQFMVSDKGEIVSYGNTWRHVSISVKANSEQAAKESADKQIKARATIGEEA